MSDICIPVPDQLNGSKVEITVSLPESKSEIKFRLEAFNCLGDMETDKDSSEIVFSTLKKFVDTYDKGWELIQAFAPEGDEKRVKVLYKMR